MFLNKEKKTVASKSWFIIQVPIISIIARDMEYTTGWYQFIMASIKGINFNSELEFLDILRNSVDLIAYDYYENATSTVA